MIRFNKPYNTGNELLNISRAMEMGYLAGNGHFTKQCQTFFEKKYNFKKCLLTTSCTDALEMAAILCEIKEGDEVIMPSYTFVSTANAFVLRGATIKFIDSRIDHPGLDEDKIEEVISSRTKAIVLVHYAGVSCDMEKISRIAEKHELFVIEDAAQAVDSYYLSNDDTKIPLGSIGHFSTFSFHQTKNISSGEGGMLVINDERFIERAEIIWEKGTNRSAFFRGEIDKYSWVDIGSSFLPSEITAAVLWAQLEALEKIQLKRISIWESYNEHLRNWAIANEIKLPFIPDYATNNGHMFYLVCPNNRTRSEIISYLAECNIKAVFHYLSLHSSEFYSKNHDGRILHNCDKYSETLLRLPFFYELNVQKVIENLVKYSNNKNG